MAEQAKKRAVKAGMRRVVAMLPEAEYGKLAQLAQAELREPNNMLAFLLKEGLETLIQRHGNPMLPFVAGPLNGGLPTQLQPDPIPAVLVPPVVPPDLQTAVAAVENARRARA